MKGRVTIIDKAFYMPQLRRWRRIWVYLPAGYATGKETFPVLYMHDGQNLFEEWSAFGEEWQVDESMDAMGAQCIVVGIDNGGAQRLTEYNCIDHPRNGKGEGLAYLQWITQTLKPYIDKAFRTKPERAHCWIAGSSMGGLISFFAAVYYPQFFGGVGIFSPSFWLLPDLKMLLEEKLAEQMQPEKIFFYAGGQEDGQMEDLINIAADHFKRSGTTKVALRIDPEGNHSEAAWRLHFPEFYRFISGSKKSGKNRR
jgi:predicted alpha/beta superfamily hydrolase